MLKLRLAFFLLFIILGINNPALAIDPFHTDFLTTPAPEIYWQKPPFFTAPDQAGPCAACQLPHKPLSLFAVTDFALRNNPQTRQAWFQALQAAAEVGVAKSAYLPEIDFGYTLEYLVNIFPRDESVTPPQFDYGLNISLNYLLLDFGVRSNTVWAAQFAQMAANFNQNEAIQQVILQVQQAYYQALGFQAVVKANQESLQAAITSLKIAEALRANGLATIGDVYQAEASLAQAKLNLQTSQGDYQIALGQLVTAMGVPANTKVELAPLSSPPHPEKITHNVNALLEKAKQNRPDLLAAEATVRENLAQLNATRASVLPTVNLSANLSPGTFLTNTTGSDIDALVTLSFPIFTGFNYTYNVRSARAQLKAAEASRDLLNQQVQFQVWQAYYNLQIAAQNIETTAILLKSSEQASAQAIGQYKAGVGNILTVLTTQTTLANARVQNIQAKLNWYVALAQLAAAIGALTSPSAGTHL